MFCGGIQIREGGSKSASGYGPGGSKSASGFGPGGPNPRGVQIRCDTGNTTVICHASLHVLVTIDKSLQQQQQQQQHLYYALYIDNNIS